MVAVIIKVFVLTPLSDIGADTTINIGGILQLKLVLK